MDIHYSVSVQKQNFDWIIFFRGDNCPAVRVRMTDLIYQRTGYPLLGSYHPQFSFIFRQRGVIAGF